VKPLKNYRRVLRKPGKRYDFGNTICTFKSGYKLINVWGGFTSKARTPLIRIIGRFNRHKYREIRDSTVLPFAVNEFGSVNNFILQKDNCKPHKANSIKYYLEEIGVERMTWLAQSPDLNPIENVWGLLKQKIRNLPRMPRNENHLFEILSQMWNDLPQAYFAKLVESMRRRITAVQDNEGKSTKY